MIRAIDVFGEINESSEFVREVEKAVMDGADILLLINSDGGKTFHASKMFEALTEARAAGCRIKSHICGCCCSSAILVLAAATARTANSGAIFHLHPARSRSGGDSADLLHGLAAIEAYETQLAESLAMTAGSNHEPHVYRKWIAEGKWFTAKQAVDAGLIDRIDHEQHRQPECNALVAGLADLPDEIRSTTRADVEAALDSIETSCRLGRKAIHRSTARMCYSAAVRNANRLADIPNVASDNLARATDAIEALSGRWRATKITH